MILTNRFKLPEPYFNACSRRARKQVDNRISVTGLLSSPRQLQLSIRHDDEISEDCSSMVWMILGSSVHYVLEKANENAIAEQWVEHDIDGVEVVGVFDLLQDGVLYDYKVTSTWSVINGIRQEWMDQLNIYGWLASQSRYKVSRLKVVAIMRDWMKSKAKYDKSYPQIPIKTISVKKNPSIKKLITDRIALHQSAISLPDNQLPECTPEERWTRPTKYACKKNENVKRASRVFDSRDDAEDYCDKKGGIIEVRRGVNAKCEEYCSVKDYCNQYLHDLPF